MIKHIVLWFLIVILAVNVYSQNTPPYSSLVQVKNKRTLQDNLVWGVNSLRELINEVSPPTIIWPDSLYVAYECEPAQVSGWRFSGDTIYFDTCFLKTELWELVFGHLQPANGVDSAGVDIINTDTVFNTDDYAEDTANCRWEQSYYFYSGDGIFVGAGMSGTIYFEVDSSSYSINIGDSVMLGRTHMDMTACAGCEDIDPDPPGFTYCAEIDTGYLDFGIITSIDTVGGNIIYYTNQNTEYSYQILAGCDHPAYGYVSATVTYFVCDTVIDTTINIVVINDVLKVTGEVYMPGIDSPNPDAAPTQIVGWDEDDGELSPIDWQTVSDSSSYWEFVDSTIDTLKNKVAIGGIVAIKGNLELQPTTSLVGQLKQNGNRLLHTYSDGGGDNLFGGNLAGNFTMTGNYNVGIGSGSLFSNTTGYLNTANGYQAMYFNTTGACNTATGYRSMYSNTTDGWNNTATGYYSLYANTIGYDNVANGSAALMSNTIGSSNIANGAGALKYNVTGYNNVAVGDECLWELGKTQTAGAFNIGTIYNIVTLGTTNFMLIGAASNTVGLEFTATGIGAGTGTAAPYSNSNTAVGNSTGGGIKYGWYNTIIGANVVGLPAGLMNNVIIADGQGNRRINVNEYGHLNVPGLDSASTDYQLYFNESTGDITYASVNDSINKSYKEELTAPKTVFTVGFPLTANTIVSYNGQELRDYQWAGLGTETLTIYLDTRQHDFLTIKQ